MVVVSPLLGLVEIEARESSREVIVRDGFAGTIEKRAPCPAGTGALLYDTDWDDVLP